jgi:DNA oxidative demethylase
MVYRAPPHPGHLAAGWPPDVGPDPPPRPAPAAIDAKRQCPRRSACHRVPGWLAYIGQAAISAIYGPLAAAAYRPDTALVNYYDPGPRPWGGAVRSRLLMPYAAFAAAEAAGASWKDRTPGNPAPRPGQNMRIHHDNGESISDLAVSLSLGDRCSFQLSNTGNHGYPCTDLTLSSGDTLVFGRQARFACHDEPRIYPGTGHPRSGLTRGRINITMRMTVLGSQ